MLASVSWPTKRRLWKKVLQVTEPRPRMAKNSRSAPEHLRVYFDDAVSEDFLSWRGVIVFL